MPKSPTRKPRFCAVPVERNFVRFHRPLRELRFAQVRRECLHDAAVRDGADKVHQGFLVSPHRECPKFPRKRASVQGIADETRRAPQLAHDFIREPETFRNGAEMFEWQIGNQCAIAGFGKRKFARFPRSDRHAAILNGRVPKIQSCGDSEAGKAVAIIFVAPSTPHTGRSNGDDRRNRCRWNGRRKTKSESRTVQRAWLIAREPSA